MTVCLRKDLVVRRGIDLFPQSPFSHAHGPILIWPARQISTWSQPDFPSIFVPCHLVSSAATAPFPRNLGAMIQRKFAQRQGVQKSNISLFITETKEKSISTETLPR